MGQRLIISEEEKKHISKIYGIIKEQSSGGYKFESVYDLPNSTVEQVSGMVKRNPAIRSGSRLVTDNPNQIVYTKKVRLDTPYKKIAKSATLTNTCLDGELEFDITFLIKENKVKMIIDNIVFNARKLMVGNSPCSDCFNYGFIGAEPNQQSGMGKLMCNRTIMWEKLINIITPNMNIFQDEVKNGFTQTGGVKDDYDF